MTVIAEPTYVPKKQAAVKRAPERTCDRCHEVRILAMGSLADTLKPAGDWHCSSCHYKILTGQST